jgi:glycerol-3-phosphate acyltransferase PlsX
MGLRQLWWPFLLGLNGTGIIAHGRANSKAIAQAVRTAYDFARSEVSTKIAKKLSKA